MNPHARRRILGALFAVIPFCAVAQSAWISVSWDSFSDEEFEGALVLPHRPDESPEVVKSLVGSRSSDGSVEFSRTENMWKVSRFNRGMYSFYVSNIYRDDDFDNWDSYTWDDKDGLRVQLRMGSTSTFRPPPNRGLVWHVFDVIGETGEIIPVNRIMPFKRTIYGKLIDAATGELLTDGHAVLRSVADGKIVEDHHAQDGIYVIFAPLGRYMLEFLHDGYIAYEVPIEFIRAEFPIRLDASLSGFLADKQHRMVVSWSDNPRDLDAHIIGPVPGSSQTFHISYRNMRVFNNRHFLDVDDTNGYGPETITLDRLDEGVYTYCVHDYTNRSSSTSNRLSYSKAVVRIYRERDLIKTIHIPQTLIGTAWRVFSFDGGTGAIRVLDQMYSEADPGRIH